MSDFIGTFQFVLMPFLVMLVFASIVPSAGCALYIRNEIMLAIALPPLTGAALTFAVMVGMPPENHTGLLAVSFLITTSVVLVVGSIRLSEIRRQIVLATLFAGGSVLIRLFMSMSSHAHAHLGFLLSGELLALGKESLLQSVILCGVCLGAFVVFRSAVFSYCIDEEMMRLRSEHFKVFSLTYRLIVVALISASVLYIGPLTTSALLIFPALTADTRKNSIGAFFVAASIVGFFGAAAGFTLGVASDIPPAYTASILILIAGLVFRSGVERLRFPIRAGKSNPSVPSAGADERGTVN